EEQGFVVATGENDLEDDVVDALDRPLTVVREAPVVDVIQIGEALLSEEIPFQRRGRPQRVGELLDVLHTRVRDDLAEDLARLRRWIARARRRRDRKRDNDNRHGDAE